MQQLAQKQQRKKTDSKKSQFIQGAKEQQERN